MAASDDTAHAVTGVLPDETARDALGRLTADDWRVLLRRLALFATVQTRLLSRTAAAEVLPRGLEPVDLVLSAIVKLLTGERHWDPARVSLLAFLQGVIRSQINHLWSSHEHRLVSRQEVEVLGSVPDPSWGPTETLLATESRQWIRDAIKGEGELAEAIVERLLAGDRPGEVAMALRVPVRDVYQQIRKIRRRLVSAAPKRGVP